MEDIRVGKSGLQVSRLSLGSEAFGGTTTEADAVRIMHAARDSGLTFWDTSNSYNGGRAEESFGKCFEDSILRDEIVLQTKVFYPKGTGPNDHGAGRRHILHELDRQLRRLKTDWIDLYYLHRSDFETPLEETIETLNGCVQAGKIRYWGTSTFPAWRLAEASWRADRRGWAAPICEQAPYNILDRRIENERLPFFQEYGIGLTCWSSLAGGLLTGKYTLDSLENPPADTKIGRRVDRWKNRVNRDGLQKANQIASLGREAGLDPVHLAVSWLLHQKGVTSAVVGPRTLQQLDIYLGAVDIKLDADLLSEIDRIVPPGTAAADFHDSSGWFVGSVPNLEGQ